MSNNLEEFTINFFTKLGANIKKEEEIYTISNLPKSFSDTINQQETIQIQFKHPESQYYLTTTNPLVRAIQDYINNAGKTTLLHIQFNTDTIEKSIKKLNLTNSKIEQIIPKETTKHFTRITFATTYTTQKQTRQIINEIYIHNKKVVQGDLTGYTIAQANKNTIINQEQIKENLAIAKEELSKKLQETTTEYKKTIEEELNEEIQNIENHYEKQLEELSTELNKQLKKLKAAQLEIRTIQPENRKELQERIQRIEKNILKISTDNTKEDILNEQAISIKDIKTKHTLDIKTKILNITAITYPVYEIQSIITNNSTKRIATIHFDPLTDSFTNLKCEACKQQLKDIELCSNGHIVCQECIHKCQECHAPFCKNCLKRSCNVCAKQLCKTCINICHNCGKPACITHYRTDNVTGEHRCTNCLRACSKCHNLTQEEYFKINKEGQKVCIKCTSQENANNAIKQIYR